MTVEDFNNTREGRELFRTILELQDEIDDILATVRNKTEPVSHGSYVDWDDSGFFDNTEIR